ncbi:MAG: acyl-ACP--UDP-N-acetylglucosamine O-acyltransferase, partial [Planctomycetia bacterium]|nr:acyl-ACP--UDP-N-acetylglucosamine O-acyltransferase [Planctomycetia bacterium]
MNQYHRIGTDIHPTAVVSPKARIGSGVRIGPFCVVEDDAQIGEGTILDAYVSVRRRTILGAGNHVFEHAVLGAPPQHAHPPEVPGDVIIGDGNMIRESCTIHKSIYEGVATRIGDRNLFMVNVHVAHDCEIGSGVVVANNTAFGGHVLVEDRAVVSADVAVHQFCRIGSFAMVGGQARVTKDVPPCVMVDGVSGFVVGLNKVGLRRAGVSGEEMIRLKKAYRML